MKHKEPLYRKVNSKARGCRHNSGSQAKYERHTKNGMNRSMKKGKERGLDYTPLYKFLLSKVGQPWNEVYREAKSRILDESKIWNMVNKNAVNSVGPNHYGNYFRYGESSYFSTLMIDQAGILVFINPNLRVEMFEPTCPCCTHSFNGKTFVKKYNPSTRGSENLKLYK